MMGQAGLQELTVLIADDDRRVLNAFARNMAHAGYQVLTASSGEEALTIYQEAAPDIALVDVRMPRVDGLAVLQTIREQDPRAEVILTTGHGDKNLVIAALRAGASDFIAKPIDQVTLQAVLRRSRERIQLRGGLRAAMEALQASEERYRRIVETIPDVITTLDREGTILFINRPIGGLVEDELIGKKVQEYLPSAERETVMQEIERVFATGESKSFTIKSSRTNAWYRNRIGPVWKNGDVVAATVISTNVTEQVYREEGLRSACSALEDQVQERTAELQGSEARFQAVFEAAQDSIFIKDRDLRYTDVNPAMARLFDRSPEELVGRTDTELFGATAGEHIEAVDARVLEGEVVEEEDTKPVNGVMRTFHVIKVPICEETGDVIGLCGIARDVTERKQMEIDLRERVETMERMMPAETHEVDPARQEVSRDVDGQPMVTTQQDEADETDVA